MTSGSPMGPFSEEKWGCKQFAWIQVQISCGRDAGVQTIQKDPGAVNINS